MQDWLPWPCPPAPRAGPRLERQTASFLMLHHMGPLTERTNAMIEMLRNINVIFQKGSYLAMPA